MSRSKKKASPPPSSAGRGEPENKFHGDNIVNERANEPAPELTVMVDTSEPEVPGAQTPHQKFLRDKGEDESFYVCADRRLSPIVPRRGLGAYLKSRFGVWNFRRWVRSGSIRREE